ESKDVLRVLVCDCIRREIGLVDLVFSAIVFVLPKLSKGLPTYSNNANNADCIHEKWLWAHRALKHAIHVAVGW
ncbi:hypothetical protein M8C21_012284, partial [Ambrosia artemisiifolia]